MEITTTEHVGGTWSHRSAAPGTGLPVGLPQLASAAARSARDRGMPGAGRCPQPGHAGQAHPSVSPFAYSRPVGTDVTVLSTVRASAPGP